VAARDLARTQKKARREGLTIVCVDESGFYLLPGLVRTYAPCGQTPVLEVFHTHDHLSVMSGITMLGDLFTLTREEALTSVDATRFLKHLVWWLGRVLVIWDGSPIHKGAVREYLAKGGAENVWLEPLPPYAPDLNPDEAVWHQLKNVELRNLCCSDLIHLRYELSLAFRRLRYRKDLIKSCFGAAGLSINPKA
jgi:transposase